MRIFVTGGTGFNGKYVVRRLDDGTNNILLLTRNANNLASSKNISVLTGNLASINTWKDTLRKFKPQAAVHLAWEGIPNYGIQNSIKNLNYGLEKPWLMRLLFPERPRLFPKKSSTWGGKLLSMETKTLFRMQKLRFYFQEPPRPRLRKISR